MVDVCVFQGWRWIGWTCTVKSTNLSKASSTWPRLASSRCGRKDCCLFCWTKPSWDCQVFDRGEGVCVCSLCLCIYLRFTHTNRGAPCSTYVGDYSTLKSNLYYQQVTACSRTNSCNIHTVQRILYCYLFIQIITFFFILQFCSFPSVLFTLQFVLFWVMITWWFLFETLEFLGWFLRKLHWTLPQFTSPSAGPNISLQSEREARKVTEIGVFITMKTSKRT